VIFLLDKKSIYKPYDLYENKLFHKISFSSISVE